MTSKCPYNLCDGSGMIAYRENGYDFAKKCKCYLEKIQKNKLEFAQIPFEFRELTVKSFNVNIYRDEKASEIANKAKNTVVGYIKKYAEMQELGKGLFFYSKTRGSGKTRLAVSAGNALIKQYGTRVRFITTIDLLDSIKETYQDDTEYTEKHLINELCEIDVLILDEIGIEKSTPWVTEKFFKILDTRMTHKKTTIITSNLSIENLQHDERIKSRLRKMVILIEMPEEDVRQALGKRENEEIINMLLA